MSGINPHGRPHPVPPLIYNENGAVMGIDWETWNAEGVRA